MNPTDLLSIRQAFAEARRAPQPARHRDIAERLGLPEGCLVAAHAEAFDPAESPMRARRLRPDWPALVAALEPLGEVMALTRNASCVHEKLGVYRHASVQGQGHVGLVLGGEIDLRVFYGRWAHGFAVEETQADGTLQQSLQFFDAQGVAIHKVFLKPQSDRAAFAALVERHADAQAEAALQPRPPAAPEPAREDAQVDVAAWRQAWAGMRDTHEFFGLMRRFGLQRTQALRLAGPAFARPVEVGAARQLLEQAAAGAVPIMVFVGNPGMIQIHTGPVRRVAVMGPWLNVLDAGFNLHLREDHIASAWWVSKPTEDGPVHSLELFDAAGETVAMFFGERKPGRPERADWQALVAALPPLAAAEALA